MNRRMRKANNVNLEKRSQSHKQEITLLLQEKEGLKAQVARLTAELAAKDADSALDKAELSRIRPHRGEPYFHSTIGEWADQCNLNIQNRLRIEKLEAELAARTEERDAARQTILDHENRESSVCPEDVGFVEYIRALEAERDGLAAALASIIAIRDEALATSEDPDADIRFGYDGDKIGYLRWGYKFELRDVFVALFDPAAILAGVKARAKAEGRAEAEKTIAYLRKLLADEGSRLKAEGLGIAAEHLLRAANDWEYGDERGVDADVIIRRLAAEISRMAAPAEGEEHA